MAKLTQKIVQATQDETFEKAMREAVQFGRTSSTVAEVLTREWYRREAEIKELRSKLEAKNGALAQLSQGTLFE